MVQLRTIRQHYILSIIHYSVYYYYTNIILSIIHYYIYGVTPYPRKT